MRNLIIAAMTAIALAATAAPTFASSSNVNDNCANILANKAGHSNSDIRFCQMKGF